MSSAGLVIRPVACLYKLSASTLIQRPSFQSHRISHVHSTGTNDVSFRNLGRRDKGRPHPSVITSNDTDNVEIVYDAITFACRYSFAGEPVKSSECYDANTHVGAFFQLVRTSSPFILCDQPFTRLRAVRYKAMASLDSVYSSSTHRHPSFASCHTTSILSMLRFPPNSTPSIPPCRMLTRRWNPLSQRRFLHPLSVFHRVRNFFQRLVGPVPMYPLSSS